MGLDSTMETQLMYLPLTALLALLFMLGVFKAVDFFRTGGKRGVVDRPYRSDWPQPLVSCTECKYCQTAYLEVCSHGLCYSISCTNFYLRKPAGDLKEGWASCHEFNSRGECPQWTSGDFDSRSAWDEPKPRPYLFSGEWSAIYGDWTEGL